MYQRLEVLLLAALIAIFAIGVRLQDERRAIETEPVVLMPEAVVEEAPQEEPNYMEDMIAACVSGDLEYGRAAAESRNEKIDRLGLDVPYVDFDELHLLSRVIWFEAGSSWLPQDWRIKVGEVLLNRVASPEFPNTLAECVYQKPVQYQKAFSDEFNSMTCVSESSVRAAAYLLNGGRLINNGSVVFQSSRKLGGGVHEALYDKTLGTTYLCYSSYPELYEEAA